MFVLSALDAPKRDKHDHNAGQSKDKIFIKDRFFKKIFIQQIHEGA